MVLASAKDETKMRAKVATRRRVNMDSLLSLNRCLLSPPVFTISPDFRQWVMPSCQLVLESLFAGGRSTRTRRRTHRRKPGIDAAMSRVAAGAASGLASVREDREGVSH